MFDIIDTGEAGKWEFFFAKLFGRKMVVVDSGVKTETRIWRGRIYVIRQYQLPPEHVNCRCFYEDVYPGKVEAA